ncbi:PREDICTED: spindle and kinetochore-associated protein 2 [Chinchilla lanigera]|uniref:spindle and kinetochore-associated protein 2 n=1 Tax=Chinchilla lanigera TaxID=34839 RepID=UPI000697FC48|nr:PREDICTED: spindle and kinetochore-associated protein 2 [Chinchilla lanigera]
MALKLGRSLESPETLGAGGWTRIEFPPLAAKGAATVWCIFRAGSRKLTLIWITFSIGWNMKSRLIILIQQERWKSVLPTLLSGS